MASIKTAFPNISLLDILNLFSAFNPFLTHFLSAYLARLYLLAPLYFWSRIIKWWWKDLYLQRKISLTVSHFESLVAPHIIANAMVPAQNFRISRFVLITQTLGIYLLCYPLKKGYFIFYLHWSYSFCFIFIFTEFHHRIFHFLQQWSRNRNIFFTVV